MFLDLLEIAGLFEAVDLWKWVKMIYFLKVIINGDDGDDGVDRDGRDVETSESGTAPMAVAWLLWQ